MPGNDGRQKNALKTNASRKLRRLSHLYGYMVDLTSLLRVLAFHLLAENGLQNCEYFFTLFREEFVSLTLLNGERYLHLVLKTYQRGSFPLFKNMAVPISFNAFPFFHALGVVSTAALNKIMRISQLYSNDTLIFLYRQLVTRSWPVLFEDASLAQLLSAFPIRKAR